MQSNTVPRPIRGWNSFDCFGAVADERALLDNLSVFIDRLLPHGYDVFTLDIGWYRRYRRKAGERFPRVDADALLGHEIDGYGRYVPAPDAFPNGLGGIISKCHEHGIKFGIHLMRGVPRLAVERRLPVLGTNVTAADIADTDDTCAWCGDNFGVDMSRPGAQAYYDSVLRLLAEWQVDYVKVDDIVPYPREIEAVADAIDRCGRPMTLSLSPGNCNRVVDLPAYRRADALRITADIWDRRDDLMKGLDAMSTWGGAGEDDVAIDLDMIPFGELSSWREPDDDVKETKPLLYGVGGRRQSRFTRAQKQSFLTQRALVGSPLLMGGNLAATPDEDFTLLTHPHLLECQAHARNVRPIKLVGDWRGFIADDSRGDRCWLAAFDTSGKGGSFKLPERLHRPGCAETVQDIWNNEAVEPDGVAFFLMQ